jgi:hypothetical protein
MAKKKAPTAKQAPLNLADIQTACRDGDTSALLAWADALEAVNAPSAALLRRLPAFRDVMAPYLDSWRRAEQVSLSLNHADGHSWWFCGESDMGSTDNTNDEWAALVGQLLVGWNEYYPAIEWLLRQVQLPIVEPECLVNGARGGLGQQCNLADGAHLAPLPAGHAVSQLYCTDLISDEPE